MRPAEFDLWLSDSQRRRPLVMGVLNVTPDSFSDGGHFASADAAVAHARAMVDAGADLIDVGGESTRPGASPVPDDEQVRRVVPVIGEIARLATIVSIDTTRATVAAAALDAGAGVVNDVTAGRDDPAMLPLIARRGAAVILMHMLGTPRTMQDDPRYADVVTEVADFLRERTVAAQTAGVMLERILLDPGIGFGKLIGHNLELLRRQDELTALGRPLVIGTSRKGFIGTLTGEPEPARRLFGTAATVAWAVAHGAAIVRVHDVRAMAQVVRTIDAIRSADFLTPQ
ncbi:MAG TPA: dihydropteroate synthase [Tepidisphaeraceae bacterium]|nr:dihydropteroate synthase [Tepidisphaeraceae bacterium]